MAPDSEVQVWARAVIGAVDKPDMVLAMSAVLAHMVKYQAWEAKQARGLERANSGLKAKNDLFENT